MVAEEEEAEVAEEEEAEVAEEEEEAVEAEQRPQEEEPTRMQNCWEENPSISKEIDETSTDSSRILSPI